MSHSKTIIYYFLYGYFQVPFGISKIKLRPLINLTSTLLKNKHTFKNLLIAHNKLFFTFTAASVKPSCHVQTNVCSGNPCLNGGICIEGWNRPICDCTATLYAGPTCGRELATLAFNGSQHMTVWLGNGQGTKTQTEELIIRFKTSRPTGLILLTSAESNSPDRLEIALVAGRVRASVRLSDREKVIMMVYSLNPF